VCGHVDDAGDAEAGGTDGQGDEGGGGGAAAAAGLLAECLNWRAILAEGWQGRMLGGLARVTGLGGMRAEPNQGLTMGGRSELGGRRISPSREVGERADGAKELGRAMATIRGTEAILIARARGEDFGTEWTERRRLQD